jgi:hypothetical protein
MGRKRSAAKPAVPGAVPVRCVVCHQKHALAPAVEQRCPTCGSPVQPIKRDALEHLP